MGMGVARALLAAGFAVNVRDIRPDAEAEAAAHGASPLPSPAAVAAQSPVIVTLVVDGQQTEDVLFGTEGLADALTPEHTVLMCSTIAPEDAERFASRLAERGVAMLDAPISGGPARAHAGDLSIMAAGEERAFVGAQAVLSAMASKCFRISGKPGDGSRMKLVNNMMAAANLAAACEAMALAEKMELSLRTAFDVAQASSGASWIFGDRIARTLDDDYRPRAALRILTKDVGLFVEAARALQCDTPLARAASEAFRSAVAEGFGEEDDAALFKYCRRRFSVG
jgi:3-hydroxyisobutyrate dehydrogenase-like beta-hydroxyacid dehydrogenase